MEYSRIGYGTYRLNNNVLEQSLERALLSGYRLIDTASLYKNESIIGNYLSSNEINRSSIWITSKLQPKLLEKSEVEIINSIKKTLQDLNTNYLDLFLLHCPSNDLEHNIKAWSILEQFQRQGIFRNIGVSNFSISNLEELINFSNIPIFTNQIELSPFLIRPKIIDYMKEKGIKITAHSSLAKGEKFNEPTLIELGKKYCKTEAQIMLQWAIQKDFYVIPRSSNPEHIVEDINLDFELNPEDMEILENLNCGYTTHPKYIIE
jgi:diketogulonate reductase-like aldo/keto reductase